MADGAPRDTPKSTRGNTPKSTGGNTPNASARSLPRLTTGSPATTPPGSDTLPRAIHRKSRGNGLVPRNATAPAPQPSDTVIVAEEQLPSTATTPGGDRHDKKHGTLGRITALREATAAVGGSLKNFFAVDKLSVDELEAQAMEKAATQEGAVMEDADDRLTDYEYYDYASASDADVDATMLALEDYHYYSSEKDEEVGDMNFAYSPHKTSTAVSTVAALSSLKASPYRMRKSTSLMRVSVLAVSAAQAFSAAEHRAGPTTATTAPVAPFISSGPAQNRDLIKALEERVHLRAAAILLSDSDASGNEGDGPHRTLTRSPSRSGAYLQKRKSQQPAPETVSSVNAKRQSISGVPSQLPGAIAIQVEAAESASSSASSTPSPLAVAAAAAKDTSSGTAAPSHVSTTPVTTSPIATSPIATSLLADAQTLVNEAQIPPAIDTSPALATLSTLGRVRNAVQFFESIPTTPRSPTKARSQMDSEIRVKRLMLRPSSSRMRIPTVNESSASELASSPPPLRGSSLQVLAREKAAAASDNDVADVNQQTSAYTRSSRGLWRRPVRNAVAPATRLTMLKEMETLAATSRPASIAKDASIGKADAAGETDISDATKQGLPLLRAERRQSIGAAVKKRGGRKGLGLRRPSIADPDLVAEHAELGSPQGEGTSPPQSPPSKTFPSSKLLPDKISRSRDNFSASSLHSTPRPDKLRRASKASPSPKPLRLQRRSSTAASSLKQEPRDSRDDFLDESGDNLGYNSKSDENSKSKDDMKHTTGSKPGLSESTKPKLRKPSPGDLIVAKGGRQRRQSVLQTLSPAVREQLVRMQLKRSKPRFTKAMIALNLLVMVAIYLYAFFKGGSTEVVSFNPLNIMVGPSSDILVRAGAMFLPCMRTTASFLPYTPIACPVGVTAPALTIAEASTVKPCTLQDYCGMATFSDPSQPNQWYRIFLAPFLHAGAVHVLLCSWLLFMTASPVEETYGSRLVAVVYVMSGVGGFLFSALFSSISPALGSSGPIFGLMGSILADQVLNYRIVKQPWRELIKLLLTMVLLFCIGLLPFLDNWAHIGSFIVGFVTSLAIFPSIKFNDRDQRIKMWIRLLGIVAVPGIFTYLAIAFWQGTVVDCPTCMYFDCISVVGWCS